MFRVDSICVVNAKTKRVLVVSVIFVVHPGGGSLSGGSAGTAVAGGGSGMSPLFSTASFGESDAWLWADPNGRIILQVNTCRHPVLPFKRLGCVSSAS